MGCYNGFLKPFFNNQNIPRSSPPRRLGSDTIILLFDF